MTRLNIKDLSEAQRHALGLPDEPERKPGKKWGTGPQAPEVAGWKAGRASIMGRSYPGGPFVHLWQARDSRTWISRCGREKVRDGWVPDGKGGEVACPRCFKKEKGENNGNVNQLD